MKNILFVIVLSLFVSCSGEDAKQSESKKWEHTVKVKEVIQTSAYTYLLVTEGGADRWIAVSRMDAKENDVLYYNNGLEMVDFKSKELNRTFPNLLLVQVISDGENDLPKRQMQQPKQVKPNDAAHSEHSSDIKSEGAVSLDELFTNKSNYNGKKVTVTGQVVKFNPAIMGKNWVHIVDNESKYDLTITTNEVVALDDNVTFEGIIILNKDFGAGYKYAIIMEEGVLK